MTEREKLLERFSVLFIIYNPYTKTIQLEKRNNPEDEYFGFVLIPGGRVEQQETYKVAARREIREEYGVEAEKIEEIGSLRCLEPDGYTHFGHVFLVTKWKGKLTNPEGNEKSEHVSATIKEALRICEHPLTQEALKLLEDKLPRQNS